MTTVLAVYNSSGCIGRCDANCHDARTAKCTCICGGKNHGAGLERAIENNRELVGLTKEDLQRFAAAHGLDADELFTVDRTKCSQRQARLGAKHALAHRKAGQTEMEF